MALSLHAHTVLPLASAALCVLFTVLLFRQWQVRRKPYQLVWSMGMLCYGLAAGADAFGQISGWNVSTYRVWYFFGAVAAAAWLGLGEVYLMRAPGFGELVGASVFAGAIPALIRGGRLLGAHEDAAAHGAIAIGLAGIVAAAIIALVSWERPHLVGHVTLGLLALGTAIAAYRVFTATVDPALMLNPETGVPHGAALPDSVRLMTPMFNIGGAMALLLGAVYSGWSFWRRGGSGERLISNGLIALGAFTPSLTSGLTRFGVTGVFYWGEFLGVLLIFAGFLASSEVFSRSFLRAGRAFGRPGVQQPAA